MRRLVGICVLSMAGAWAGGPATLGAEASPVEAFVRDFRRSLGLKSSECAEITTRSLRWVEDYRYFEERDLVGKRTIPREVICFLYSGELEDFKRDFKTFVKHHGKDHRARTFGRWRNPGDAKVNMQQQVTMFTQNPGAERLEIRVGSVSGEVVFDPGVCVATWYERRK